MLRWLVGRHSSCTNSSYCRCLNKKRLSTAYQLQPRSGLRAAASDFVRRGAGYAQIFRGVYTRQLGSLLKCQQGSLN